MYTSLIFVLLCHNLAPRFIRVFSERDHLYDSYVLCRYQCDSITDASSIFKILLVHRGVPKKGGKKHTTWINNDDVKQARSPANQNTAYENNARSC